MAEVGLGLVALGLVIALFIVFASAAQNMMNGLSGGTSVNPDRRKFVEGVVAIGVSGILASAIGGQAINEMFSEASILRILSGGTYTVSSGENEEYEGVMWEDTGTLVMQSDSSLTITET